MSCLSLPLLASTKNSRSTNPMEAERLIPSPTQRPNSVANVNSRERQ
jgi:hypothetical protein